MQQRVIELGKTLVKELNVEPGVDTLTRWITHYIAELLAKLEASKGDDKIECQNRCFEAILTLWHHRSFYKNGSRPFENFEPILRVLESLDYENPHSMYLKGMRNHDEIQNTIADDVKAWVNSAVKVDELARTLIGYCIQSATSAAADDKTIVWLNTTSFLSGDDLEVIINLVEDSPVAEKLNQNRIFNRDREKMLESRLYKLEELIKISDQLRLNIVDELTNFKANNL